MDVQIMGVNFNYLISPRIYYPRTSLNVSVSTFYIIHSQFCTRTNNTHM